jgi:hypothetical protein
LLEAVFFTARVSIALNGTDNLYEIFSARRSSRLSAVPHTVFPAFVADVHRAGDRCSSVNALRRETVGLR